MAVLITVRPEEPEDRAAVRAVNERAFGCAEEADVVDRLRERCEGLLSLVATRHDRVVGHILFSPASIDGPSGPLELMGLAPMAVLPECQRQGVGSALVETGLAILRERGCPAVIVLGHPEYYPRFGFAPASRRGIGCQWPGLPDEAFMIVVFDERAMKGVSGVARYRDEFDAAM
jgi:putative acetyltransferase